MTTYIETKTLLTIEFIPANEKGKEYVGWKMWWQGQQYGNVVSVDGEQDIDRALPAMIEDASETLQKLKAATPERYGGEEPIFRVFNSDLGLGVSEFKVWADGRIEGFPPGFTAIINSIPIFVGMQRAEAAETVFHASARALHKDIMALIASRGPWHPQDILWLSQQLDGYAREHFGKDGLIGEERAA